MKRFLNSGVGTWVLNIVLAVVFYAYTAHVKAMTEDQLRDYLPREQFTSYVKSHQDNETEIIKRIDATISDIKENDIREIKESLREIRTEIMRRPGPPMRQPSPL